MIESNLILIASQPRSGSTLLQRLLSSNPNIKTTSETWFLLDLLGQKGNGLVTSEFDNKLTQSALTQCIDTIGFDHYKKITRNYILEFYQSFTPRGEFFVDKTPRYYEILDLIEDYLPDARKICLLRHPLDVLDSILRTWVNKGAYFGNFYRDICVAPLKLNEWLDFSEKPIIVYYEELVKKPVATIKKIGSEIGLHIEEDHIVLNEHNKLSGGFGDRSTNQNQNEILNTSLDTWKSRSSDKIWWDFFMGYAHFLGEGYFKKHHFEYPEDARRSSKFDEFELLGVNGLNKIDVSMKVQEKIKAKMMGWGLLSSER